MGFRIFIWKPKTKPIRHREETWPGSLRYSKARYGQRNVSPASAKDIRKIQTLFQIKKEKRDQRNPESKAPNP